MGYYDYQMSQAGANGMYGNASNTYISRMPQQMYSGNGGQAYGQQFAQMPARNNLVCDWVQGEIGARAYPVGANCMGVLLDSEDTTCFYLKTVDNFGMPAPLRKFRFKEENLQNGQYLQSGQQNPDQGMYVTKDELEKMVNERITAKLEELTK